MRKAGSVEAFSAFFMCPVSHTFPAYNGNVMPRRVSTGDACAPFYGLRKLFFLCGLLRQFARVYERLPPQCPGTPRVKPSGKSRLFSTGGQSLFYGLRFSANLFFSCGVLRGCVGVEGAFALGGVPSCPREEKRLPRPLPACGARLQTDAEPGYFPPQTLRLSAGRSNHSGLFRCKNLPGISRPFA